MKIVGFLVLVLVVGFITGGCSLGLFRRISFLTSECGGEIVIYKEVKGDYKQCGPVGDEVYYSLLNEDSIETFKGFGCFYDDPQKVARDQLRSEAGCILEPHDYDKISSLKKRYRIRSLPRTKYVTTEIPFKGKLSILVGLLKVYPALEKYVAKHSLRNGPVIEIYDIPNKRLMYRKEIVRD